jgi:TolB protein
MRTATIITIILFLVAVIFLGYTFLKAAIFKSPVTNEETELEEPEAIIDEEPGQVKDGSEDEYSENKISKVEIYLDGDRNNGIFLGEAVYGVTSQDAYNIYGENFSETGFLLAKKNNKYSFEPGSVHYLYVYTLIPASGWDYHRKEIIIPGEPELDENIKLSVDNPDQDEVIKESEKSKIKISGWSADFGNPSAPGIESIEIYLNGPKGFGKLIGKAEYGIERQDVARAFGNTNYTNCGYCLYFDGSDLEEGSENTLYIYSFSSSGNYNLGLMDIIIEGEKKEPDTIISVEANLNNQLIEISGWAINKNDITEGKPRETNVEYNIKKIIFTSDRTGNEDIFSMNIDVSELTQLTDYSGRDNYPAASPDGKKITYTSDINGTWQVMVMDWDGKNKKQITNNPYRSGFSSWSFDGRFIYFEAYVDDNWEIYRIDSDGSNMKRLTFNTDEPDWHPCGHPYKYKVIYESGTTGNEDIYIMDHDGKNVDKISDENMRKRVPSISVDGKIIVFSDNNSLYTMDNNGKNIKKISGDLSRCRHSGISPDMKYVVFESVIDGNVEIILTNLDGSNTIRLTTSPTKDYDPVFLYQAVEN